MCQFHTNISDNDEDKNWNFASLPHKAQELSGPDSKSALKIISKSKAAAAQCSVWSPGPLGGWCVSVFSDQGACQYVTPGGGAVSWPGAGPSGHSSHGHQSHCKAQTPSSSCLKCEMGAGTRSPLCQLVWLSLSHHFDAEDFALLFCFKYFPCLC